MNKVLCIASVLLSLSLQAQTIVEKRLDAQTRLHPLVKVTVGRFDNYDSEIAGSSVIYSRKLDLSPFLIIQNLKTQKAIHLLSGKEDAEQVSVAASLRQIAFIYYKNRSFGQVCIRDVDSQGDKKPELNCLQHKKDHAISSPFWVDEKTIGYLRTDHFRQVSELVIRSLKGKDVSKVIDRGSISSPSASRSGRLIVYSQKNTEASGQVSDTLSIYDRSLNKKKSVSIDLPGVSGLPSISDDEKSLYFSQFIDDTNKDQIVDGNDNSVIFRVPLEEVSKSEAVYPEQLTSFERNCNYPKTTDQFLYLTCGFQGSLDIYRLPLEGMVPAQWSFATLEEAHRAARTYEERLLILQAMRYRHPKKGQKFQERLVANYLQSENFNALSYYLPQLEPGTWSRGEITAIQFFQDSMRRFRSLQSGESTRRFERYLDRQKSLSTKKLKDRSWRTLYHSYLTFFRGNKKGAERQLRSIRLSSKWSPIFTSLYFQLLLDLEKERKTVSDHFIRSLNSIVSNKNVSDQSKVYFGVESLKLNSQTDGSLQQKAQAIDRIYQKVNDGKVKTLMAAELLSLKIIAESDAKKKKIIYRDLDKIIRETRTQYFLKRAIYSRTIFNFAKENEFQYLNFIANNWMRFTKKGQVEFAFARENLVFSVRDRAYSNYRKGKLSLASNHFYQALSLTDDLESHYGYVRVMLELKKKELMHRQYENLEKRQFVKENLKFVEALLLVMQDSEGPSNDLKKIEAAIQLLDGMGSQFDSPIRALLLGYCQLQVVLRSAQGYKLNLPALQASHRNLMLAMDLGDGNDRVEASALSNLGLLHYRSQGHRLAVKFFEMRGQYPFISQQDLLAHRYYLAASYYRNHEPKKAYDLISAFVASPESKSVANKAVFTERQAFYAFAAGLYKQASLHYQELLKNPSSHSNENLSKFYFNYGLALLKVGEKEKSYAQLKKGQGFLQKSQVRERNSEQLLPFVPEKLMLNYSGLLARVAPDGQRSDYLLKRQKLLKKAGSDLEKFSLREDQVITDQIKNELQLASVKIGQGQTADPHISAAVEKMKDLGELNDLWIGEAFFQTSVSSLAYILGQKNAEMFSKTQTVFDKVIKGTILLESASKEIAFQSVKIQMMVIAGQKRFSNQIDVDQKVDKVWQSQHGQLIKADPVLYKELNELQKRLRL